MTVLPPWHGFARIAGSRAFAALLVLLLCAVALDANAADGDFIIVREATAGDGITTENSWATLDWDTTVKDEGAARPTLSGGNQILLDAGHHLILYSVKATQASGANDRTAWANRLQLAGGTLAYGYGFAYMRDNEGAQGAASFGGAIIDVATDDDALTLQWARQDSNSGSSVTRDANASGLQVLKLADSLDYLRIREVGGGQDFNTTTFTSVDWDTSDETDTGSFGFTPSSTNITLKGPSGTLFLTFANVGLTGTSVRKNTELAFFLDGSELAGSRTTAYDRGSGNINEAWLSGAFLIAKTSASDQTLTVRARREDTNAGAITVRGGETGLTIVALPADAEAIRLTHSAVQDLNTAGPDTFPWDTEDQEDAAAFTHDPVTNNSRIAVDVADDYLFFAQAYAENNGVSRVRPLIRLRKNGGSDLPYAMGMGYGRNSEGSVNAGVWVGTIAEDLVANDYFEATHTRGATNTGAFNSDQLYFWGLRIGSLSGGGDWYASAWPYRKTITIDSAQVPSDQTNFPVLISLGDSHIGANARADGFDLLFTDTDGVTKLDHEIETYTTADGTVVAWVRVPLLTSATDKVIHLYYGNSGASDQQNAAGVWDSDYVGVWHLKEDPGPGSPGDIKDSTGNAFHGTTIDPMTSGDQGPGQINGSIDFTATGDEIIGPTNAALDLIATDFTISAWALNPVSSWKTIVANAQGDTNGWSFRTSASGQIELVLGNGSSGTYTTGTTTAPAGWVHMTATFVDSSNTVSFFLNGAADGTDTFTSTLTASDYLAIGRRPTGGNSYDNWLDEVRISKKSRSADWIQTEYNNQSNAGIGGFLSGVGDSETEDSWYDADWQRRKKITIDSTQVIADETNFPVLISFTDGQVGASSRADGFDLLFTDTDGITKLDHEIETFTTPAGTLVAWVRIPLLTSSVDKVIYLYYGNSGAADQQNASDVWDTSYIGVWHLKEDPAGGAPQAKDSTTSAKHGTSAGGMTSGDQIPGAINGSLDFDADDRIDVGNHPEFDLPVYSWSMWVKGTVAPDSSGPNEHVLWNGDYNFSFAWGHSAAFMQAATHKDSEAWQAAQIATTLVADTWYYITGTYDSANIRVYLNGGLEDTQAAGTPVATTDVLMIGYADIAAFAGQIDEVRVSDSARSASWIQTSYNNQSAPGGFGSVGDEVYPSQASASVGGTIISSVTDSDIVTGGKTLVITLTGDTWVAAGGTCNGAVGDVCGDGTVYAGTSPDGSVDMWVTRCDEGQSWTGSCTGTRSLYSWNNGTTNWTTTGINNFITGKANTTALDVLVDAGSGYLAAEACEALSLNGHTDWYLPAHDEMEVMYTNRVAIGGFDTSQYWSSSEDDNNGVWEISFSDGSWNAGGGNKSFSDTVRCARTGAGGGGAFDSERQNIINGLTSAQSETTGWNNEVRDKQLVGGVVRTSDTVVTITLDAQASYDITASETIESTIPATALVTSGSALTATPTFDITAVVVGAAEWEFDDGSGQTAADSSGNSRDATLGSTGSSDTNDPAWLTCAIGGSVLEFDGVNDYVEDADGELYINSLDKFTLSAWIKADAVGTDRGFVHTIVPDNSDSQLGIRHDSSGSLGGGTNVFKVGLDVNSVPGAQQLESSNSAQTTSWQHVAVVWKSGDPLKLYIDGNLDTPTYNSAGVVGTVTNATTLRIGQGGKDDVLGGWDGLVDQVRFFDTNLNASEISALAATAPSGCAAGPVAHWDFDEGSGQTAADSSGFGNDGQLGSTTGVDANDPTWECVTGGYALDFNGTSDYVDLGSPASLNLTTTYSVAGWVKWKGGNPNAVIYASGDANADHYRVDVNNCTANGLSLREDGDACHPATSDLLPADTWHHIAVIKDGDTGTNLAFYLDGVSDGTASAGTSGATGLKRIGARTEATDMFFDGVLDDLRIYDRALSGAEVSALAASPPAACPMALVARYWMEEVASGQSPAQLIDDQVSPLDLSITYDGANPTYIAPSTGRGWSSATTTNNGRASILADSTKIQTALDGSTKASIELVVRVDAASSSGTRLIHIGSSTESGHFTVEASPTKIEFYLFGETIRGEWNPAWDATRMAFHLVYDSTQPTAADRVKLYKNGVLLSKTGGTDPPLNETISVPAGKYFVIGNREVGGRSLDGDITYAAVYDGALSASEISSQATALLANDDSVPAAAGTLYRSVGTNGTDLNTSARTVEVSGTTATFSGSMPANVGVGDVLQYQVAATWYVAVISGRTSNTVYTVKSASGATPQAAVAGTAVNVYRAYTSLNKWESQNENDSLNDLVEDFDTSTDLVTANTIMQVAAYADGVETDGGALSIDGWTTGPTNYIRIYTPVSSSEVGISQRHTGVAGTGYVRRPTTATTATCYSLLDIRESHVRVEGLELDGSGVTTGRSLRGIHTDSQAAGNDIRISHNLIHDIRNSTADDSAARSVEGIYVQAASGDTYSISNNIIYAIENLSAHVWSNVRGMWLDTGAAGTSYVFNNTVYDVLNSGSANDGVGIKLRTDSHTYQLKNNYVGKITMSGGIPTAYEVPGAPTIVANNNVSSDATADDFGGAGNVINQSTYASYFTNVTAGSEDLHLVADSNALWGTYGEDLDSDPNLPVTLDIDGDTRDSGQPDVGADEVSLTGMTTTSTDGIWSGTERYIHHANGNYWAVFYDGSEGVIFSSADGSSWTSQGNVNVTASEIEQPSDISARFSGTTVIVAYGDDNAPIPYNQLYYRHGTLNAGGTVTWWPAASDELIIQAGNHEKRTHAAFDSNSLPWIGGAGDDEERFNVHRGSAAQSPTWTDRSTTNYGGTTQGGPHSTVLFPTANPGDMYGLTNSNAGASDRDIIGAGWDDSAGSWGAWQEVVSNDLSNCADNADDCMRRWSAVRTSLGEIHLAYINDAGVIVHRKGTNALAPTWSTPNANITGLTSHSKVTLAANNNDLTLFYDKSDDKIYYREFDGSSWGGETELKSDTTPIQGGISAYESIQNGQIGVIWAEGSASPYAVQFALMTPSVSSGSGAVGGTVTASAAESDIVTGGKTVVITLTDDTWVAAGATFDAQRQNIINGLDSAQSEGTGWDAVVKAGLSVTDVARTSSTVVTITLPAFGSYEITANETITATLPATALTGASQIVATPAFLVAVDPEAAVSGTITSANEDQIRTGGRTLLLTLTGDTWVTSGGTFDAQRQNIINGLDSAQVEATGWDAVVKAGLAVTDVVRTSNTVVTITLPAFGSYDITGAETITATVPATAVTSASVIIATPSFIINTTNVSGQQEFVDDGVFTVPGGVTQFTIKSWGGGGGGGSKDTAAGGDGGGGGYVEHLVTGVSGGDTFSVAIGRGGEGGNTCGTHAGGAGGYQGGDGVVSSRGNDGGGGGTAWSAFWGGDGGPGCAVNGGDGSTNGSGGGGGGACVGQTPQNGSGRSPGNSAEAAGAGQGGLGNSTTCAQKNAADGKVIFIWGSGAMAGLSGSLIPNALQSEVIAGGETLVITLTGDTWDPTIGADNALTTALINGLVSAGGGATGWNAEVKANLTYNEVVRTSNTVVTLTLPARPSYGITASEVITVTVPAATVVGGTEIVAAPPFSVLPASAKTESRVAASSDDAEELLSTNAVTLGSLDLQLIDSGGAQEVGMRFLNVLIPPGASITNAYIEFTTTVAQSGATDLTLRAEAVDDSTTFASAASDVSTRAKTTASVAWSSVPSWNTVGETHQTPNLSAIIQEVVDRGGWVAGKSISIFVTGTGARTATSYDGNSAEAPLLHVDFNPGTPLPPPNTLGLRVSASTDDAEEMVSTGAVDLVSPTLELVDDGGAQQVGMRFQNVAIDPGSIITRAYLEFTADVANFGTTNLTVEGQASDNAPTFTSGANDLSTRLKTATSVDWSNAAAWATGGQTYQSVDLSPIIQELIDRSGWVSGNSVALFVTGGGRRTGESWDGNAAAAPLLHLEFMAPPVMPSTTVEVRISGNNDDAEEFVSGGAVNRTSTDLEFVADPGDQIVGMRWASLPVPPGVTITNAYIELTTDETGPNPTTNLTFWAQAADSPIEFSATTSDISNRPKTTASVAWNGIPSWTTTNETHQTPDLAAIIQEVIDRPGWASGNAIVVISEGTGERIAHSHDGVPSAAALLHVEYAPICDDGNICTVDVWDFTTQSCGTDAAAADGFACSDSLYCTTGNFCSAGVCGAPVDCSYLDGICTVGFCDEGADACVKQDSITWFDPSWQFRKPITVDSTKVTGDLDDFPVLVSITDTDLAAAARADGFDIAFTDSDGFAKLDHEIEKYDGGSGELVAWVRVRLSSSTDKTIYMYYGNAGASDQQNASGVWDPNYVGVWHLREDQAGTGNNALYRDSTSNSYHGDDEISATGQTGKLGAGQQVDGTDDYVDLPSAATSGLSQFAFSMWVKTTESGTNGAYWQRPTLFGQSTSGQPTGDFGVNTNNGYIGFWSGVTPGSDSSYLSSTLQVNDDAWHHILVANDGANASLYVDGAFQSSLGTGLSLNSTAFWLGGLGGPEAPGSHHGGSIDELRVSAAARSAAWIQTEYNNQNSPGTFHSVGAEQGQLATCQDCDDGNPCTVDTYNSGTQTCTNDVGAADGLACNDGLFCTIGSTCSTGVCGAATDCSSLDSACAVGVCDEAADSCVSQSTGTWYDASWTLRKPVTVDSARVTADLTDFPVLVSVTDTDLAAAARADGWDIVFTDDDETTKLAYEIERYNPATGELVAWVKVPNLTGSTDKVLYMYYGNASSADQQNASAVWDADFVSVHHLKESPSGGGPSCIAGPTVYASATASATYVVPTGCDTLTIKAWGAGGGAGGGGGGDDGGNGGGGGFAQADISVTPSESLDIVLGGGGPGGTGAPGGCSTPPTGGDGGGGNATTAAGGGTGGKGCDSDGGSGGGGGGYAAVKRGGAFLVEAGGGGGGGGGGKESDGGKGGAGGGSSGVAGSNASGGGGGGGGGTTSAGGSGGSGGGSTGAANSGGNGADSNNSNDDGGGGGGGRFGGGGGGDGDDEGGGGGGGGSSLVSGTNTTLTAGSGTTPANNADPDYAGSAGVGGSANGGGGSPGRIVLIPSGPGSGPGSSVADSTANANDGVTNGGMDAADQVTGQIGYALDFDGTDDYANVSHHADYETNDRTLSAWVYNTDSGGEYRGIFGKNREGSTSEWLAMFRSNDASGLWHARSGGSSSDGTGAATGTWTYLVMTNSRGGGVTLYRNGSNVDVSFTNGAGEPVSASYDVSIGRVKSVSEFFQGRIDEARWSKVLRSTAWIQTEYNNQSAPVTFLSLGAEEDAATACGSCDDGNSCTTDTWDSGTSTCIYDSSGTDGLACSDGLFCTTGNICAAGVCGATTDCSFLDGSCQIGICDEPSDSCVPQLQGVCNCDDGNACTVDSFDTLTFTCIHDPAPVDGLACDDGLFCTLGETCSAGFCRSSVTYDCTSLDGQCQTGVCDEGTDACVAEWHGTWKDPLWGFRKTITVDQTKVPSDLTDYPMLVSLTDADLAAEARSDGRDIFFTEIDGITKLDHELERYQSGSGTIVAWVRIPSLTSSADKQIYMYYGNSGASAQENPTAVWDASYKSVYHMDQDPSSSALGYVTRGTDWTTGTSHTVGAGDDRLLLFVTGHEKASADTDVTSVSYGGQSLTQITQVAGGGPGAIDERVSAGSNDSEETVGSGAINRTSGDLAMVLTTGGAGTVARVGSWTNGTSHTVGAGSDRVLVFATGYENGSSNDTDVTAVSYGGQALTPIGQSVAGTTTLARVELWYLNEAGIQASSGTTFNVTYGNGSPSNAMHAAATYQNVDQATPIADTDVDTTTSVDPIDAVVNVTAGAMAISGAVCGNSGTYAWGNGWAEGTDQDGGSSTMSTADNPATGSGTDTASANHSSSINRQVIVAATLNPSSSGSSRLVAMRSPAWAFRRARTSPTRTSSSGQTRATRERRI